jgi:hypothetical protein
MCYHKEMATLEHVTSMKVEVAELLSVLGNALEEILTDSKMTDSDVERCRGATWGIDKEAFIDSLCSTETTRDSVILAVAFLGANDSGSG